MVSKKSLEKSSGRVKLFWKRWILEVRIRVCGKLHVDLMANEIHSQASVSYYLLCKRITSYLPPKHVYKTMTPAKPIHIKTYFKINLKQSKNSKHPTIFIFLKHYKTNHKIPSSIFVISSHPVKKKSHTLDMACAPWKLNKPRKKNNSNESDVNLDSFVFFLMYFIK